MNKQTHVDFVDISSADTKHLSISLLNRQFPDVANITVPDLKFLFCRKV